MLKSLALLAALALGSFAVANADPIQGSLGFALAPGSTVTWDNSTIFFNGPDVITSVSSATGDTFSPSLMGTDANFFDGTYLTANYSPTSYLLFTANDGVSLSYSTITAGFTYVPGDLPSLVPCTSSSQTGCALSMTGYGTFTETGFDPTFGTFILTASQSGTSITFEATADAPAVPEPTSLALFGTGLLGIVGIARRKFNV